MYKKENKKVYSSRVKPSNHKKLKRRFGSFQRAVDFLAIYQDDILKSRKMFREYANGVDKLSR